MTIQPSLFIPHGGGPCFFMPDPQGKWTSMRAYLEGLAASLPARPRAILIVSGHWETPAGFAFTGAQQPELIFDYHGFPDYTYALTYSVPGDPALAGQAAKLLMEGPQKDRHLRLQNMAIQQSKEKDAALPQQEADAKAAPTGDADVQVGEAFWSKGQNDKAVEAIQRGIKKGVKDKDDANLRLGVVYLSAGKRNEAANAFKALTPNSASAQIARLWTLLGSNAAAAAAPPAKAAAPAAKTAAKK